MYATAHIIQRPHGAEEAIHMFLHHHGPVDWPRDVVDWPETNPGVLVQRSTPLPLGGNRVRAYLDVLAPDGTPWEEILRALRGLGVEATQGQQPLAMLSGRTTIRFGAEYPSERARAAALERLVEAMRALLEVG